MINFTAVVMRPEYVLPDLHSRAANPWVGAVRTAGPAEAVDAARLLAAAEDARTAAGDLVAFGTMPNPDDYVVAALFFGEHRNLLEG